MRCCSKSTTWRGSAVAAVVLTAVVGVGAQSAAVPDRNANGATLAGAASRAFDVRAGDRVRMRVTIGPLTVEGVGVALQSGRVGETIRLTNPDSRRQIQGRITGPGCVEVRHGA